MSKRLMLKELSRYPIGTYADIIYRNALLHGDREAFICGKERVTGGENVFPREVEEVLYRHSAVEEVAVIGVPDKKWVERVHAVITLKEGQTPSAEDIGHHPILQGKPGPLQGPAIRGIC